MNPSKNYDAIKTEIAQEREKAAALATKIEGIQQHRTKIQEAIAEANTEDNELATLEAKLPAIIVAVMKGEAPQSNRDELEAKIAELKAVKKLDPASLHEADALLAQEQVEIAAQQLPIAERLQQQHFAAIQLKKAEIVNNEYLPAVEAVKAAYRRVMGVDAASKPLIDPVAGRIGLFPHFVHREFAVPAFPEVATDNPLDKLIQIAPGIDEIKTAAAEIVAELETDGLF